MPLSVATDLTLSVNGAAADVSSTGERLFVAFDSMTDAARALRRHPEGAATRLAALLTASDLTLEVRVRSRTVAVAGSDARPGPVSRALRSDPVELRLCGVLGAAGSTVSEALRVLARSGA